MSKKDTLLKEATVRRFMKLANIGGLTDNHVKRLNEGGMYDEDMYEQEGDEEPMDEPAGGDDPMGEPEGAPDDLGEPEMGEPEMGDEEDLEMGMGDEEPAGGGDAATSIVDATVAGLEQGLKAAGLLGDDDSLTTSSDEPGGEEPMDDLGDEEPVDDLGDEEPMGDLGDEAPPEEEDPEALEEQVLSKLARNVARRLLERRVKTS